MQLSNTHVIPGREIQLESRRKHDTPLRVSKAIDADRLEDPKLLIVSRIFGASGQPWLWRQVLGLRGWRKELVCWERRNAEIYLEADTAISELHEPPAPYDGASRWWYRLRNLPN